jgi:serine/threonine protein kinase
MDHLGKCRVVHFDLAARNVLLTHPEEIVKIADFGLSKIMVGAAAAYGAASTYDSKKASVFSSVRSSVKSASGMLG